MDDLAGGVILRGAQLSEGGMMSWDSGQPSLNVLEELLEHPFKGAARIATVIAVTVFAVFVGGHLEAKRGTFVNSESDDGRARLSLEATQDSPAPLLRADWEIQPAAGFRHFSSDERMTLRRVYRPSSRRGFLPARMRLVINSPVVSGATEIQFGDGDPILRILRIESGQLSWLLEREGRRQVIGHWDIAAKNEPLQIDLVSQGDVLRGSVADVRFEIPAPSSSLAPIALATELQPEHLIELRVDEVEAGHE